ncbi:p450 domain-containing protein [Cephalotus follicularis]|uniref:p450 domain-containing protein n=1 Tax=Cephalotus follicularis TaxID=3775 RepID=A0A1Q3CFA5_CEPFO|nr:p450 domain-containing protein [Cephalotus follicularis]
MAVLEVVACLLLLGYCISIVLSKWNEIRYRRKGLPSGTMGWPVFGETTEFLELGPNFIKKHRARHGTFFKSHILGCPTIISMDPEVNRYILMNEKRGLIPGYPQSCLDILGKYNIAAVHGSTHNHIRGSLLSLIGPPIIRDKYLPAIDKNMRSFIDNWDTKTIDIQDRTKEMAFFVAFKMILGKEPRSIYEAFKSAFDKVALGTLSLPINIPGTNYHRGFQGRKSIIRMLKQIVKERRASSTVQNDMVDQLLSNEDSKYKLGDQEIFDQIITILYSGYETVSATSMMAIKYLYDNPRALQQLREEHLAIRERKRADDPIDWNDYKSMTFTRAVIFETSRLATIVNGVLRKTTQDIELNGFIIPEGWRVYVYTREINYDPILYPEPLTFDPWRWLDKSLESHNHCFIFGAGTRLCPGKELGMVTISTFLHYFVTKYRWELIGGEKILKFPRVVAPKGLHVRLSKY